MSENFEKLKICYNNLYIKTGKIAECIKEGQLDDIEEILKERRVFFEELEQLAKKEYSQDEKILIKKLADDIKVLEDANVNNMQMLKYDIKKKVGSLRRNNKAISAYSLNKHNESSIIDSGA